MGAGMMNAEINGIGGLHVMIANIVCARGQFKNCLKHGNTVDYVYKET